jgi:hypothetical protein
MIFEKNKLGDFWEIYVELDVFLSKNYEIHVKREFGEFVFKKEIEKFLEKL